MDENHLNKILENYIARFNEFNRENEKEQSEYYKWEMPLKFKQYMDIALNTDEQEEFVNALAVMVKLTDDFTDYGTIRPFAGLKTLAGKKDEWEHIQQMFRNLYAGGTKNCKNNQRKIGAFLSECRELEKKYKWEKSGYRSDYRSVTTYLFLYDPDHNYAYKPNRAKLFAKYMDVTDDFGGGDTVKLENYYKMCDALVEKIKNRFDLKELEKIREERASTSPNPRGKYYKDPAQHILAYDIIYCTGAYKLYEGISLNY